jgi:hypothetical protein
LNEDGILGLIELFDDGIRATSVGGEIDFPGGRFVLGMAKCLKGDQTHKKDQGGE